MAHLEYP